MRALRAWGGVGGRSPLHYPLPQNFHPHASFASYGGVWGGEAPPVPFTTRLPPLRSCESPSTSYYYLFQLFKKTAKFSVENLCKKTSMVHMFLMGVKNPQANFHSMAAIFFSQRDCEISLKQLKMLIMLILLEDMIITVVSNPPPKLFCMVTFFFTAKNPCIFYDCICL